MVNGFKRGSHFWVNYELAIFFFLVVKMVCFEIHKEKEKQMEE